MFRMVALVIGLVIGTTPAAARCLLFCWNGELAPAEAVAVFERDLGAALPPGVTVLGMIDGGFQDRFVQIKLGADKVSTAALLVLLHADTKRPLAQGWHQTTITQARWWDIDTHADIMLYDARLGRFAYAVVGQIPDPADPRRRLIYVIAFET
jgi:hypothetical protein